MNFIKGENPAGTFNWIGDEAAYTMRKPSSQQIFNNIFFKVSPCRAGSAVKEQSSETVVKIGVQ